MWFTSSHRRDLGSVQRSGKKSKRPDFPGENRSLVCALPIPRSRTRSDFYPFYGFPRDGVSRQGPICEVASAGNEPWDAEEQRGQRASACPYSLRCTRSRRDTSLRYDTSNRRDGQSKKAFQTREIRPRYIGDVLARSALYALASDPHEFCRVATHFSRKLSFQPPLLICKGKS